MIAIIPAAGKGTRMADVTGGAPKELVKLGRQTVLERIVREARSVNPDRIVVVSSTEKAGLSEAAVALGAEVVLQELPLGLADAVARAASEDDAVILFGDCAFHGPSPLPRMAELVYKGIAGCVAVEPVSDEDTWLYGIVEVDEFTGGVKRILEKPGPEATESRWAIAARYALSAPLMNFLVEACSAYDYSSGVELSLTPLLNEAIKAGFDIKAVPLQPGQTRVDCGSPEEYRLAQGLNWED